MAIGGAAVKLLCVLIVMAADWNSGNIGYDLLGYLRERCSGKGKTRHCPRNSGRRTIICSRLNTVDLLPVQSTVNSLPTQGLRSIQLRGNMFRVCFMTMLVPCPSSSSSFCGGSKTEGGRVAPASWCSSCKTSSMTPRGLRIPFCAWPDCAEVAAGRIIRRTHRRLRTHPPALRNPVLGCQYFWRKYQLYSKPSYCVWPSLRMSTIHVLDTQRQSPSGSG